MKKNIYSITGLILMILNIAFLFFVGLMLYERDLEAVLMSGFIFIIAFAFSFIFYRIGIKYGNYPKLNKNPMVLIIISLIIAFIIPILINFGFCGFDWEECALIGFLVFSFIFGPIGGILFLIGIILLFIQTREKIKK